MLKNIIRIAALGAVAVSLSTAAFADGGADTYKAKCQMCHGTTSLADSPAGKAMKAPSFKDPASVKMTEAEQITITTAGKGKMPAYSGKLSAADIKSVVEFVRTLQK